MTISRNNVGVNLPTTASPVIAAKLNTQSLSHPSKECSHCGAYAAHFLHHVRLLGNLRRLCTSCVLRLNPSSFCPACFAFYGASHPHPSKRIACSKCSSFTHSHCVVGDTSLSSLSSYLCPPCKDPSFSFFPLKDHKIDKKLSLALLCAAKIAASSMGMAATLAWAEADMKTREAALARKRAREALEHLLHVAREEKARKKENENVFLELTDDANPVKVEDLDTDNADADFDAELVRDLEESLVKDEDIDL